MLNKFLEDRNVYVFDTEFIEYPRTIDFVSIGICEYSFKDKEIKSELYLVSNEFNPDKASEWVKQNVLDKLNTTERNSLKEIKDKLLKYIKPNPIFIAYCSDYDWVNFCWIFGSMSDLPKDFPMYCIDLRQEIDIYESISKTKFKWQKVDKEQKHNALYDTKYECIALTDLLSFNY